MHLIKYRRTAVVVIPMFIKKTARKLVKIYNNSNIADILSPYKLPRTAKLFEMLYMRAKRCHIPLGKDVPHDEALIRFNSFVEYDK